MNSNSLRRDKSAAAPAGLEAISLARIDRLRSSMPGKETLGAGGALGGARAMLDALLAESARVRDALLALNP